MKKVEIYELQKDGSQKVIATCRLVGENKVECEGDPTLADRIMKKSKLYAEGGLKFLRQLKRNFKSGYLNASDIIED